MSLLDSASLILTPNAYSSSKIYSIIPSNGNGDAVFTRNSQAIVVNSSNLLTLQPSTLPRLQYPNTGSGCPSFLFEYNKTQLVTFSTTPYSSSTFWNQGSGSTSQVSTINSPEGIDNAYEIIASGSGEHYLRSHALGTSTSGSAYTVSAYVKQKGYQFVQLRTANAITSVSTFDFTNKTITAGTNAVSASFEELPNGWYRVWHRTTPSVASAFRVGIHLLSGSSTTTTFTAPEDNTDGVYLYGPQIEVGGLSSYIPTTGSATATRIGEPLTISNLYTNGIITNQGGTWYVELDNTQTPVSREVAFGIRLDTSQSLGSIGTGFRISPQVNGKMSIISGSAGSITNNLGTTNTLKIAMKWNGTNLVSFFNNNQSASVSFTPTNMEYLHIGGSNGPGVPMYLRKLYIFPKPLTDDECRSLIQLQ
jgi:hypothetical protein